MLEEMEEINDCCLCLNSIKVHRRGHVGVKLDAKISEDRTLEEALMQLFINWENIKTQSSSEEICMKCFSTIKSTFDFIAFITFKHNPNPSHRIDIVKEEDDEDLNNNSTVSDNVKVQEFKEDPELIVEPDKTIMKETNPKYDSTQMNPKMDSEIIQLRKEIKNLKLKLNRALANKEFVEKYLRDYKRSVKELVDQCDSVMTENLTFRQRIEDIEDQNASLENEVTSLNNFGDSLHKIIENGFNVMASLKLEIESLTRKLQEEKDQLRVVIGENNYFKQERYKVEKINLNYANLILQLNKSYADEEILKKELRKSNETVAKMTQQCDTLKNEIARLNRNLTTVYEENAYLGDKLATANSYADGLNKLAENYYQALKSLNTQKKTRDENLEKERNRYEYDYEQLEKEIDDYEVLEDDITQILGEIGQPKTATSNFNEDSTSHETPEGAKENNQPALVNTMTPPESSIEDNADSDDDVQFIEITLPNKQPTTETLSSSALTQQCKKRKFMQLLSDLQPSPPPHPSYILQRLQQKALEKSEKRMKL